MQSSETQLQETVFSMAKAASDKRVGISGFREVKNKETEAEGPEMGEGGQIPTVGIGSVSS